MSLVELLKSWDEYAQKMPRNSDKKKGVKKCMKDLSNYINKNIKHDGMRCPNCKTMNLQEVNGTLCCSFCGDNADADKFFLQNFDKINEELNDFLRVTNEESKQKIRQCLIDLHAIIIS